MKIAIISMIKNECDIIELFIKHNSKFADKIFLMDHQSTDGTDLIVKKMADKGYSVVLSKISELSFSQAKHMTAGTNEAARGGEFDFVIPLDADEFLSGPGGNEFKDFLSASFSPNQWAFMNWVTFCPISGAYFEEANPLAACFRARSHELGSFQKVVLGGQFARDCNLSNGNHFATHPELSDDPVQLDYAFQHLPVRSSDQIVRKILLSTYAFSLKSGRRAGENFHWYNMLRDIRSNNYSLSDQALLDLSLTYGDDVPEDQIPTVNQNKKMDISEDCSIEFESLARINLVKSIDDFTTNLVDTHAPPIIQKMPKNTLKWTVKKLRRILR
jgi:glycosyltransferase involved in cell wall biosynthesis